MADAVIESTKERMNKTIAVLKTELGGLRAGRANPQLLERIMVDYYGTPTPIQQLGNISTPEPRMLIISVWDQKAIPAIEKAIQKSDLGINPANDGQGDPPAVPGTQRGAPQGARQSRPQKGRGEQGRHPFHPAGRDGAG